MQNPVEFEDLIIEVVKNFVARFELAFGVSDDVARSLLVVHMANLYRRWYYSSYDATTILNPALVCDSIGHTAKHPDNQIILPNISISNQHIEFRKLIYRLDAHPVVIDFRKFAEMSLNNIPITEDGQMTNLAAYQFASGLSIFDTNYVAYLMDIFMLMDFAEVIPGIRGALLQPSEAIDTIDEMSDRELLDKIVEKTIHLAAMSLSSLILNGAPAKNLPFDEEFVTGLLTEPRDINYIFEQFFNRMGLTSEEFLDRQHQAAITHAASGFEVFESFNIFDSYDSGGYASEEEEENMALLAGSYLFGMFLDKYIFLPFGHYLHMLRPIYTEPFTLLTQPELFTADIPEDIRDSAFFSPPVYYHLTDLGLEYFGARPHHNNYLPMSDYPVEYVLSSIFPDSPAKKLPKPDGYKPYNMYRLKITNTQNTELWLSLDVPGYTTLHALFQETALWFEFSEFHPYNLFIDESENPFTAYSSPDQVRRVNKALEAPLEAIGLKAKQAMVLLVKSVGKFHIQVQKKSETTLLGRLPEVVRMGKSFKESMEHE